MQFKLWNNFIIDIVIHDDDEVKLKHFVSIVLMKFEMMMKHITSILKSI